MVGRASLASTRPQQFLHRLHRAFLAVHIASGFQGIFLLTIAIMTCTVTLSFTSRYGTFSVNIS